MRQHGIILKTYHSGEADLILRLFTPDSGRISIIARNARRSKKRFNNSPDVFDCGVFELRKGKGSLLPLSGFQALHTFSSLRESLEKMTSASMLCEALEALTVEHDSQGSEELYELVRQGLQEIDAATDPRECYRSLYLSLSTILEICGYLDRESLPPPSAKNLLRLVNSAEAHAERKLQSKTSLVALVNSYTPPT
jgi:DNA repair protein RecO (recombination protein O)